MTNNSIQKHIQEFCEANGISLDAASTIPEKRAPIDYGYCVPGCEVCQGVGLIASDDGGWVACPNNPRRFYNSGVSESDAQLWQVLPQKTKAVERIMDALKTVLQARKGFVYIHGTPGIGKTVCARAFTVEAIQAGMRALYTRQSELINHLRASYDTERGQEEYQTRLRLYKDIDWLTIDELGRDRMNDFARESLAEIIDARYTSALSRNKVTILVSNFAPEEIFPAYIVDRVRDKKNTVLALQGRSLRL
jgi:DNA replication protein DnaC